MKRGKPFLVLLMVLTIFAGAHPGAPDSARENPPAFLSWSLQPPLGWNSWDCYGPSVTEAEVKANADYMAAHLKSYGWEFIVVDIRWFVKNDKRHGYNKRNPHYAMDEWGRLLPAENKFPSAAGGRGFKPLADYVHGQGLKFGIHVMRGVPREAVRRNTPILGSNARAADIFNERDFCPWLPDMYSIEAGRPGAQEYYNSIFQLYQSWGVDYVKVDDLSEPYHAAEIEMIRKAIDKTGRPMVFSTSPGPTPLDQAAHVKAHANLWRISGDVWDAWKYVFRQFALCREWANSIGPSNWPDADMLPLGRIGIRTDHGKDRQSRLTPDEQIALMTLWSIFRSPLMFGGDLPSNDEWTLSLLTNAEVLAVDQHSGKNREFFSREGQVGWTADVPAGRDKYVALFNLKDSPPPGGPTGETVSMKFEEVGLHGTCAVRDLWARKDLGEFQDRFAPVIPWHGAGLYRISCR